jgi:site-specific recombinase XerD
MTSRRTSNVLPSGNVRARMVHRGEVVIDTVVASEAERESVLNEVKRRIVDGDLKPTKGSSVLDNGPRFLASRSDNRAVKDDESRWYKHHAKAAWAILRVADVTKQHGDEWLKKLERTRTAYDPKKHGKREPKRLSFQMRKHLLNLGRAFFAWAIEQGLNESQVNPFATCKVARTEADDEDGYQDGWYLDASEQTAFLATWKDPALAYDRMEQVESLIAEIAMFTGMRQGELWCLHLADVSVADDGDALPYVHVKYGSWSKALERYLSPKRRKGGKKKARTVYLWGRGLEAMREWLAILPTYAPHNPHGLVFPTERGLRRDKKPPRTWKKAVDRFGSVARLSGKVWWHLLRHTCASSLVAGWWSAKRWTLGDVSAVLGHSDMRTTEQYAHLAPTVLQQTVRESALAYDEATFARHAVATSNYPDRKSPGGEGHAREDSNLRPTAPEAVALSS